MGQQRTNWVEFLQQDPKKYAVFVYEKLERELDKKIDPKTGKINPLDSDTQYLMSQINAIDNLRLPISQQSREGGDAKRRLLLKGRSQFAYFTNSVDPLTINKIFGGKKVDLRKIPNAKNLLEVGDYYDYDELKKVRSNALTNMLGEELGAMDDDTDPVSLIDFAEYDLTTDTEKELVQGDRYNPLKSRKEELQELTTGTRKNEVGQDTREMLNKAGEMSIGGLKSAVGSSEGAAAMQTSFSKLAIRGSAQNAMQERMTQFKDKQAATSKLATYTTDMVKEDMKRKAELQRTKSKAAIGLAGAELTASEHAAQIAKSNLI